MDFLVRRGVWRDGVMVFRVSLLVSCPYRWLYSEEVTEAMVRGTVAHEKWQERLRGDGWLTEYEVSLPITDNVLVQGHLDAYHPEKHVVLEAKTSKTVYWIHTRQLEVYRWMLWKLTGKIPDAYLVYLDYDGNERHRVKPFLASPQWVERYVKNKLRHIAKYILENWDMPRIPDKLYCPYCPFKENCPEAQQR